VVSWGRIPFDIAEVLFVDMFRSVLILSVILGSCYAICSSQELPTAEELLNDLACGSCHEGIDIESDILDKAADLSQAGLRYGPDWVFDYIQYPIKMRQYIGASRMPIMHLDQRESLALALYLQTLLPIGAEPPAYPLQASFVAVRDAHPDITAEIGEDIFTSLGCIVCHQQSFSVEWDTKIGPDHSFEGARATPEWLDEHLRAPTPVRPFGYYPGSGSRHPDFQLTESEVETLGEYLRGLKGDLDTATAWVEPELFLRFSAIKAETLMREKLPCLGCHRLGDDGGRIGPDLSSLNTRLQPEYVAQVLRDPVGIVSETVMPKVDMPDTTLNLLINYLILQDLPRPESSYLSHIDNPPYFYQELEEPRRLYVKHCVPCHGPNGDADGYNVPFLPVVPTTHSDSAYMSDRPDDTLFDGIYSGGYILNKSHRMPPWGVTLEREEIWGLVRHMRELCNCEGPAWSRDGRRRP
jgi:mono/diheme cytochrome c family protein